LLRFLICSDSDGGVRSIFKSFSHLTSGTETLQILYKQYRSEPSSVPRREESSPVPYHTGS
jgi:hypothetical protein